MKKNLILLSILLFFAITLTPQTGSALGLEVGVGYWGQSPSGELAYNSTDKLDIESDLNYDKEYKPFARIKVDMPLFFPNLYLVATPIQFDEAGSMTQNFTFGDITFDATADFNSKLKMNLYDIGLYYSLPFLETATLGKLNAELGINIRIVDLEAEVSGESGGSTETQSESITIPVPMVYAGIQINPVDLVSIEAEARVISYNSNHFYDFIGRVKVKPAGPLFFAAGYRSNDIKIDESDVDLEIKFSGPFIEGGLFF